MKIDGLLKRALAVEFSENFDPSKVPMTGEEYLQHVILEASQCEEIVTVDAGALKKNKIQPICFEAIQLDGCKKAPADLIPTLKWQEIQVSEFSRMRRKLSRLRQKEGRPYDKKQEKSIDEWREFCSTNKPKLSNVLYMNQSDLDTLLEYHSDWLEELVDGTSNFEECMGMWIYSIFACLETPLLPDTCSSMRRIARKCAQMRATLPTDKQTEEYSLPLSLIICLVGRYFNQSDLADSEV